MVVCGLLWLAFPKSETEPVAVETEIVPATSKSVVVATTVESPATDAKRPEPQSKGVEQRLTTEKTTAKEPVVTPSLQPTPSSQGKTREVNPIPSVPEEPRPVEVKKTSPVYIDVASRLADRVAGLELTDIPLSKAVETLAGIGALPITFDTDSIRLLGVASRDRISLKLESTTIGDALQAIAAQKGLAVAVENDQVLVTTPLEFRETLRTVRYSIDDLAGDEVAEKELASMIQKLVAPTSWQSAGGRGSIECKTGLLVVNQTGKVHRQVLTFCEKLRNARHLPFRSRENPETFTLKTRVDQAQKMLAEPVTAVFHEPTPLANILAYLSRARQCNILIDRVGLSAAETSDHVEATLTAKNLALGTTLDKLLRPLGLTYLVIDPTTVEVTTREAADERLELEFHPMQSSLAQGMTGAVFADRLKARVLPATWSDVGGLGEVFFDPPSRSLMVLQSQTVQTAIERVLQSP
jgi:hypothetical protein